jgi:thioesterase domain-containing protein
MNDEGALLPRGTVGEVVIRGRNVMNGYENNDAANAAAFTDGWFRTGDQGWLDGEGYLFLTGRLKEIINRGGEKISPREIDEALLAHPAVRLAASFPVPHARLGEEIGAAVEVHAGTGVTPAELRHWTAARLPEFKVPRIVRIVDAIPKGPTGKLQRIGLAAALGVGPLDDVPRAVFAAPRTALEQRIAAVWRDMLPGARIGVLDRFDALGGDSLLAATMLAAVAESIGYEVPAGRFIEEGTIAALAADIEYLADDAPPLRPLQPDGSGLPLYALPGHEGSFYGIARLAKALGTETPVWGFDLRKLAGARSIEELARRCVALLKAQHSGPYQLVGSCFGGIVAFEMARQLHAAGDQVKLVALVATLCPRWHRVAGRAAAAGARFRQTTIKVRHHTARIIRMTPRVALKYSRTLVRRFIKHHAQMTGARLGTTASMGTATLALSLQYTPAAYAGDVLVFRAPGLQPDIPALGWLPFVNGRADVIDLPCPCVGALAEGNLPSVVRELRSRVTD